MRPVLMRLGGAAAALGGLLWVKGVAILVTGHQPPVIFEASPALLAAGVVSLYSLSPHRAGRLVRTGGVLAFVALTLGAVVSGHAVVSGGESPQFLVRVALVGSTVATLAGLVVLGIVHRRSHHLPAPWRNLPLLLGLSVVPLLVVGGMLAELNERLLEVPLVFIGLGWIVLGVVVSAAARDASSRIHEAPTPLPPFRDDDR